VNDHLMQWHKDKALRSLPRYHAVEVYDTPPATKWVERIIAAAGIAFVAFWFVAAFVGVPV